MEVHPTEIPPLHQEPETPRPRFPLLSYGSLWVDPALLTAADHPANGGILNQQGWNLPWFGVATLIGGLMICFGNMTAIRGTGMAGRLPDLGCLLFVDFPGAK